MVLGYFTLKTESLDPRGILPRPVLENFVKILAPSQNMFDFCQKKLPMQNIFL